MKHIGENVVRIEAEALRALADRIGGPMAAAFQRAVDLMFSCAGRVVVTGMGKSGLIARKIAATLSSTGTPALYLHPVEALHGDLGMVVRGDVVLALSASGETEEILALLATIKRLRVPLIAMTGDAIFGTEGKSKSKAKSKSRQSQRQRAGAPALLLRLLPLWLLRRMWLWIVRLRRRLARWGWRLRLRLLRCWLWGMRWRSRSARSAGSRKKISRTCIREGSWASGWRGWNR